MWQFLQELYVCCTFTLCRKTHPQVSIKSEISTILLIVNCHWPTALSSNSPAASLAPQEVDWSHSFYSRGLQKILNRVMDLRPLLSQLLSSTIVTTMDDNKNLNNLNVNHHKHCKGSVRCRLSSREESRSPRSLHILDPLQKNKSQIFSGLFGCRF